MHTRHLSDGNRKPEKMGEEIARHFSEDSNFLKPQALSGLANEGLLKERNKNLKQIESTDFEKKRKNGFRERRSDMEIFSSILQTSREGVNKTRILYHANLSYAQLKNYLDFLIDGNLLEERHTKYGERVYITTRKGNVFLNRWDEITCMVYEGGII